MRLDIFLKTSRLIKRRSVAKELCDRGKVEVGGAPAKAGREIKAGDVLTMALPRRKLTVEVGKSLPETSPRRRRRGCTR